MRPGATIEVFDAFENTRLMIVCAIVGEIVLACRKEEMESARCEEREPTCIGLRLEFVKRVVYEG